jgi:hypothetical protein
MSGRRDSLVPALFEGAPLAKNVLVSAFFDPLRGDGSERFRQVSVRTTDLLFLDDRERRRASLHRWREDRLDRVDVSAEFPAEAELGRFLSRRHVRGTYR